MKYTKAAYSTPIEKLEHAKARISIKDSDGGFAETPWVGKSPDHKEVVLLNDALTFMPFRSWGALLQNGSYEQECTAMRASKTLALHPEAFDSYVENGYIDEDGNVLDPNREEMERVYDNGNEDEDEDEG